MVIILDTKYNDVQSSAEKQELSCFTQQSAKFKVTTKT